MFVYFLKYYMPIGLCEIFFVDLSLQLQQRLIYDLPYPI